MPFPETVAGTRSPAGAGFLRVRQSFHDEIDRLSDDGQIPLLVVIATFWIVCMVEWTRRFAGAVPDPRFWTLLSLAVTMYGGIQVFRLRPRLRQQTRVKRAARRLIQFMNGIPAKGFVVYNDFSGEHFRVDHVLVGPSGIYVVEARARTLCGSGKIEYAEDKLVFGGRISDSQPIRQARTAIDALRYHLGDCLPAHYPVRGVVVFLDDWEIGIAEAEVGLGVITPSQLEEYFERQQPELTNHEVYAVCSHLERFSVN